MIDKFVQGSKALALLAIAVLALEAGQALPQLQHLADEITYYVFTQNASTLQTQATARAAIDQVKADVSATRQDIEFKTAGIQYQLAMLSLGAFIQLDRTNNTLEWTAGAIGYNAFRIAGEVERVSASATQLGDQGSETLRQVNEALPLFLDCDHNADCFHNRWVGFSRAAERAAITFAETQPHISLNVQGITADVHTVTSRYAAKRSIAGKIWEGMKLGGAVAARSVF